MSSVPAMKITKNVFNLIEDVIDGAVVNAANIEQSTIDDLLESHSNKITIMPTDNDYSQSCTLEMREQALYEVRRGLLSTSLESLRSCVNKNEIIQKHRTFDKYPKSKFQTTSPDIETSKAFTVESLICNSKQSDVNMEYELP